MFFLLHSLKQRKTKPTTPRIFNKTCLQHEVLTKCCHSRVSDLVLVRRHTRAGGYPLPPQGLILTRPLQGGKINSNDLDKRSAGNDVYKRYMSHLPNPLHGLKLNIMI